MKRTLARLFTLVCFFHFSGLNNGYTYEWVASVDLVRSVSLAGRAAGADCSRLNPVHFASIVGRSCESLTRSTFHFRPAVKDWLTLPAKRIVASAVHALPGCGMISRQGTLLLGIAGLLSSDLESEFVHTAAPGLSFQKQDYVTERREDWLRTKSEGAAAFPRGALPSLEKTLLPLPDILPGLELWLGGGYAILERFAGLYLRGGNRSGEDAFRFSVKTTDFDPSHDATGFFIE